MYQISKKFYFSASHQLNDLPVDHPCSRLHGHNYCVKIVLQSNALDATGFVIDYGELRELRAYIDNKLDHRHLNDLFDFNPTAENLAKHLYKICKLLWDETQAVYVSETDKTWACYYE